MSRLYPALDLIWCTAPSEDRIARLLVELDDEALMAVEARNTSTRIFFSSVEARGRAATKLRVNPELSVEAVDVSDEDWAARSQADLAAVEVGRLTVAPPWVQRPPGFAGLWIAIQPSMGFGTGHHATTRLCLRLIQEAPLAGKPVLDVGTGSGVLAIAAARLGAARVLAIDNDPDSLTAARENVELNDVANEVELAQADVGAGFSRPDRFDLVLANLTGAALVRHALALSERLSARGSLIASGYGVLEAGGVVEAFGERGLLSTSRAEEDGWIASTFTIPTSSITR